MQGAVVSSMLRSSRKGRRKITAEEVNNLLNEPIMRLFEDMDQVDSVIKDTEHQKIFGLSKRGRTKLAREIQIEGMLEKVREKMGRSDAYMRLLVTICFKIDLCLLQDRDLRYQPPARQGSPHWGQEATQTQGIKLRDP